MAQQEEPGPVARLALLLEGLPSVGPKVAGRAAAHIAQMDAKKAEDLAEAIERARNEVTTCATCRNLADQEECGICGDPARDRTIICVVEQTRDLMSIERSWVFRGLYHVLHGSLAPGKGVGPEDIELPSLIRRATDTRNGVREIVVATNPSLEGDATADYIRRRLEREAADVRVTRLARGLPTGVDVSYADQVTLAAALRNRRPV